jgi:hypothetical protein
MKFCHGPDKALTGQLGERLVERGGLEREAACLSAIGLVFAVGTYPDQVPNAAVERPVVHLRPARPRAGAAVARSTAEVCFPAERRPGRVHWRGT